MLRKSALALALGSLVWCGGVQARDLFEQHAAGAPTATTSARIPRQATVVGESLSVSHAAKRTAARAVAVHQPNAEELVVPAANSQPRRFSAPADSGLPADDALPRAGVPNDPPTFVPPGSSPIYSAPGGEPVLGTDFHAAEGCSEQGPENCGEMPHDCWDACGDDSHCHHRGLFGWLWGRGHNCDPYACEDPCRPHWTLGDGWRNFWGHVRHLVGGHHGCDDTLECENSYDASWEGQQYTDAGYPAVEYGTPTDMSGAIYQDTTVPPPTEVSPAEAAPGEGYLPGQRSSWKPRPLAGDAGTDATTANTPPTAPNLLAPAESGTPGPILGPRLGPGAIDVPAEPAGDELKRADDSTEGPERTA